MITIQVDTKATTRWLDDLQRRQVPFATALALTKTAKKIEQSLKAEMASGFGSPSPYTLRSTFSTSATKSSLMAIVGIKDKAPAGGTAPSKLLKEHFTGGSRGNKPMEVAMMAAGALRNGWRVVPGAGMPLDAYGNPKRNAVREILGALRSKMQIYKGRGKRMAMVGYFVVPVSADARLAPGVYWRSGRAIRPMFLFVESAGYRKRFDLPRLASTVVAREFNGEFNSALAKALASAR